MYYIGTRNYRGYRCECSKRYTSLECVDGRSNSTLCEWKHGLAATRCLTQAHPTTRATVHAS